MTYKPYKGVLTEQMDPELSEAEQLAKRLEALADHYRVQYEEGDPQELLLALARNHVSGFRYKPDRQGRRPERAPTDLHIYARLSVAEAQGQQVTQAARRFVREYSEFGMTNPKTIERRYYAIKKSMKTGGREARNMVEYAHMLAGLKKPVRKA